jgi:thiol-disulfide isomerase/thioredoxin
MLYSHYGEHWSGEFEKHVRIIVEKNQAPLVRVTSRFALASLVRAGGIERQAEAERLFRQFVAEFDGKPESSVSSIEKMLVAEAKHELARIERCGLGKPAQEIVGEDLGGQPVRLSDHRGKVVLLVFWASWCAPCMADVPHEKELVERFKGRPFVLIGVNGDGSKDAARKAVTKAGIPWRSAWDGERDAAGPITRAWAVIGWPTVFVIDHNGIIRHDRLRGKRLDKPLEELVSQAEKAGNGKR